MYADIVRAQAAAQPFAYPSGLVEVPMSPVSDVTAFRTHYWKLDWFLTAVRLAVEEAVRTGGVFDFLAHPSCLVVEDPTFEAVKLICDLVKAAGDKAAVVDLARSPPAARTRRSRRVRGSGSFGYSVARWKGVKAANFCVTPSGFATHSAPDTFFWPV